MKNKKSKKNEKKKSRLKELLEEKKKEIEEEKKKLKQLVKERELEEKEVKEEAVPEKPEEVEEVEAEEKPKVENEAVEAAEEKTEKVIPVLRPRETALEERVAEIAVPEEKKEGTKYEVAKSYEKAGEGIYTPEAAAKESRKYVGMGEIPITETPMRLLHKEFSTELIETKEGRAEKKYEIVKEEREFPFRREEEKRKYKK